MSQLPDTRPLLPPRPFSTALMTRTAVLWLILHAIAASGAMGGELGTFVWPLPAAIFAIGVIAAAVSFEVVRQAEDIFLANLGYSMPQVVVLVSVECLVLEAVLRLTVG